MQHEALEGVPQRVPGIRKLDRGADAIRNTSCLGERRRRWPPRPGAIRISLRYPGKIPIRSFTISGGRFGNDEYVAPVVEGREMKRATGHQTKTMRRVVWNVAQWRGKKARILIADSSMEAWGVINADDFRYCTRRTMK